MFIHLRLSFLSLAKHPHETQGIKFVIENKERRTSIQHMLSGKAKLTTNGRDLLEAGEWECFIVMTKYGLSLCWHEPPVHEAVFS